MAARDLLESIYVVEVWSLLNRGPEELSGPDPLLQILNFILWNEMRRIGSKVKIEEF